MSTGLQGFIDDLGSRWRERAGMLAHYGAMEASETLERAAEELAGDFRRWWLEALTVPEAAKEAGYSRERLAELVRDGTLPAVSDGTNGHKRVRRCDLPRKPVPIEPPTPQLDRIAARLGIAQHAGPAERK